MLHHYRSTTTTTLTTHYGMCKHFITHHRTFFHLLLIIKLLFHVILCVVHNTSIYLITLILNSCHPSPDQRHKPDNGDADGPPEDDDLYGDL